MMGRRNWQRGFVLVSALLALGGCSVGEQGMASRDRATERPSSPPAVPSPIKPTSEEAAPPERIEPTESADPVLEEVLTAYLGYWQAILEANDPPDEFHPALERYATGEAFESVFEAAQTNRLAGRALLLPEDSVSEHRAEVISIEGDTATVRDCAIDDGLVVDVETGEVVNDDVVTRLATGTLRRVDGQWKVATTRVEQSWEGVAGCALDA